ncbi:hypothetical protein GCM10027286_00330 [Virgibacillus ainsalahensis]
MNETHSILQRMRELSVQSSNDTNTDSDRAELQKEVDQLANALTDISEDTEFNTKNLLKGDFEGTFHVGANEGQNLSVAINDMSATALKAGFEEDTTVATADLGALSAGSSYSVVSFDEVTVTNGTTDVLADARYGLQDNDGNIVAVSADGGTYTHIGAAAVEDLGTSGAAHADGKTTTFGTEVKNGTVTVSAEYDTDGEGAMGSDVTATGGINIASQTNADEAITTIQSAIDTVSAERSKLGAVQNRLDHTINNLGTSAENLTAAESRIRDVDYTEAA